MLWLQRNCAAALVAAPAVLASFGSAAAGVPGSKGHPLLTRFKGAVITHYQVRDFDQAVMPIKLMASADPVPSDALATAEGKVARIDYSVPGEETALEVMRKSRPWRAPDSRPSSSAAVMRSG